MEYSLDLLANWWQRTVDVFSTLGSAGAAALQEAAWPALAQIPPVVWLGAALWIMVRTADRVQLWGGMRTSAYAGCGALLACGLALQGWLEQALQSLQVHQLLELALGWVLFTLGQRMDARWLLRNKALAVTAVLEFALTAVTLSWLLLAIGLPWLAAVAAGLVAAHSSPVILASFMHEWRADGQISARSLHLGGINTLLAALSLPMLLALGEAWQQSAGAPVVQGWRAFPFIQRSGWELAEPLLLLLLSLGVGTMLGRLLSSAQRNTNAAKLKSLDLNRGLALVAAACVCAGLAQWWGAPAWAACLALGLSLRSRASLPNVSLSSLPGQGLQAGITALAQLLLFALSAFSLVALILQGTNSLVQLEVAVGLMIPLIALVLLVRLCAKLFVCTLTARWAGLRWQQGFALGLMMQPLSMTGLALLLLAWPVLIAADAQLALSLCIALFLSDAIAPRALRYLLLRCGEIAEEPDIAGLNSRSSTQPTRIDTSQNPPSLPPDFPPDFPLSVSPYPVRKPVTLEPTRPLPSFAPTYT
jgi:Kef-type K+ transport system membrane component KefB